MNEQQSMHALAQQVISPTDHAVMGGEMARSGLSGTEISNLVGLIERVAVDQAANAARSTALALIPILTKLVQDTHRSTAMEIHRLLSKRAAGFAGLVTHRDCADIALAVANTPPRHAPIR